MPASMQPEGKAEAIFYEIKGGKPMKKKPGKKDKKEQTLTWEESKRV